MKPIIHNNKIYLPIKSTAGELMPGDKFKIFNRKPVFVMQRKGLRWVRAVMASRPKGVVEELTINYPVFLLI